MIEGKEHEMTIIDEVGKPHLRKHKSEYTPDEIARLDALARKRAGAKGGRVQFGSSKHRKARIQKFTAKQRKKKNRRKHR